MNKMIIRIKHVTYQGHIVYYSGDQKPEIYAEIMDSNYPCKVDKIINVSEEEILDMVRDRTEEEVFRVMKRFNRPVKVIDIWQQLTNNVKFFSVFSLENWLINHPNVKYIEQFWRKNLYFLED